MSETDSLLTVRDVARRVGRSEETVRRWIWSGKLRARKIGNQLFVDRADLEGLSAIRETKAEYGMSAQGEPGLADDVIPQIPSDFGKVSAASEETHSLHRAYGYSPAIEDLREHRGQILPSPDEEMKNIVEDEAFQDDVRSKFGDVDVLKLLRDVRDE